MFDQMSEAIGAALGLGVKQEDLELGHMALRALVVFVVTLVTVRLGNKRFLGRTTAFDMVLVIILGSTVSRAINTDAPFFPTLGAGFVLVALHWLMAAGAFHSHRFGNLVKGRERPLFRDGELRWDGMRHAHITERDLLEAVRTEAKVSHLKNVESACLERSGRISVIKARGQRVVDLGVSEGVQKIRVELS